MRPATTDAIMKHFFTLLGHELRMLLVSLSTYIAAAAFLGFMGFVFTEILTHYSKAPQETSPARVFFELFWLPVFFMVPLLTMKCLAEERRLGTIETLLTTPVTTTEVVLAKYGAAYFMYVGLWGSTAGFFYLLHRFAGDMRFIDPGPLLGGYFFVALSGLLFVAIGVFASSLSRSQAVAGILCFTMLFALVVGMRRLGDTAWFDRPGLETLRGAIDYAQIFTHRDDFTRGVIDTRHLLFYLSGTTLALIFSVLSVEARQLHS